MHEVSFSEATHVRGFSGGAIWHFDQRHKLSTGKYTVKMGSSENGPDTSYSVEIPDNYRIYVIVGSADQILMHNTLRLSEETLIPVGEEE